MHEPRPTADPAQAAHFRDIAASLEATLLRTMENKEAIDRVAATMSGPIHPGTDEEWPPIPPIVHQTLDRMLSTLGPIASTMRRMADEVESDEWDVTVREIAVARQRLAMEERHAETSDSRRLERDAARAEVHRLDDRLHLIDDRRNRVLEQADAALRMAGFPRRQGMPPHPATTP